MATCSISLKTTEEADKWASGHVESIDSQENVSVNSGREVEIVERITYFYNSTANGDSDAVKDIRQKANN